MTAIKTQIGARDQASKESFDPVSGISATDTQKAIQSVYATAVAAAGTAAWGSITGTMSAQSDLQSALDAKQPIDSDLTAIAALTTLSFGRSVLELANAAAGRTLFDTYSTTEIDAAIGAVVTDLASTSTGEGASLVGIEDAGSYFSGSDVESALQYLGSAVAALDQAVVLKGTWDASAGTLPGVGAAQAGWSYIVSVDGTVDSVDFVAGDRIVAILDNASTSTYAANWIKLDYTDRVSSVAGKTGAVTIDSTDITDTTTTGRSLMTTASAAAARSTLGLVIGTDIQAYHARLADISGASWAQGDIMYFDGANLVRLPAGTSGQVLQTNGAAAPSWVTPSGGGGSGVADGLVGYQSMTLSDFLSYAHFPNEDMIADHFDSLAYVNTGGSTNLDTGTAGVLQPTASSDTYSTTADPSLTANAASYGGYSARQLVPASALSTSGDRVRITLTPPTSGNNTALDDVWIGHAGTAPNFDGTQVRVTFSGGSTGVTLTAGGAQVTSDIITYSVDETKDLIIAFDWSATADVRYGTTTGYTSYQKAATSGQSGNTSVTGYSTNSNLNTSIDLIEVRTATGSLNNLTVVSDALPFAIEPSTMYGELLVVENESITINTDLLMDFSIDGGSNWVTATLTLARSVDYGGTTMKHYTTNAVDVSGQTYSAVHYRLRTANNKDVEFHAAYAYGT